MKTAAIPVDEEKRLAALKRYEILDSKAESSYDQLTALASYICQTPIALISLVDSQRQWFKSKVGLSASETSRDWAFCAHAILGNDLFVVEDTHTDDRFMDNPLVVADPNIRFYAGAPLITQDGFTLGTLCAIDHKPRRLNGEQVKALRALASQVVLLLDLRMAFKQIREQVVELRQLTSLKDRFLRMVSHDLRAPFTGILGLAEILVRDGASMKAGELSEFSTDILTTAQETLELLENLLSWSRFETGSIPHRPMRLELCQLISSTSAIMTPYASRKSINLTVVTNPAAVIWADATMIQSLLQNLINNAVKFTPAHGRVGVSTTVEGSKVLVEVVDTGIGMSEEQIAQFAQGELNLSTRGTAGESGTGLGLQLCRRFTAMNGGEITLTSKQGQGTKFTVTFPKID